MEPLMTKPNIVMCNLYFFAHEELISGINALIICITSFRVIDIFRSRFSTRSDRAKINGTGRNKTGETGSC
jgi:hypothetical protein